MEGAMSSGMIPAQPEKILRALGEVWTSLGEEERQQGKPTVLRACAMTLIVVTDEEDQDSITAMQTLIELMHAHPSRAIVLRSDKTAENGLSARVSAQCWKPFGKAQQICCEQIEVLVHPDRWLDVGPTLLGIVVPDLPVVVWCRQNSVLRQAGKPATASGLDSVLALATKVIVDTRGSNLQEALSVLAGWRKQGHIVGDLEWTRLTAWRETLATTFGEDPALLEEEAIQSVRIGYAGESVPASAQYLAAWLKLGLPIEPSFERDAGDEPGLTRLTLSAAQPVIDLARTGPTCLQLRTGDQLQRVSLSGSSYYELMHEELTILGPDPVFDAAFNRLAGSAIQEGQPH
jgi:glucose-6-phosphate dehydrogenase assembly protein OpcA